MKSKMSVIVLLAACLLMLFSCQMKNTEQSANSAQTPTWEEYFEANVQTAVIDGETRYMVEGDLYTNNIDDVKSYFETMVADLENNTETSRSSVHLHNGSYDVYTGSRRWNLTYTIDSDIPSSTRTYLTWALNQWENYADVDFIDVTGTGQTPFFELRNATTQENNAYPDTIASAFFPSWTPKELVLFDGYYDLFAGGTWHGWDQKAVLLHELGHGLGLRHEFIWRYSWWRGGYYQYYESSAPAELLSSAPDTDSIMYYPQYSAYTGNGRLSSEDTYWIGQLYP
ncbi:MAG: matrixin family metalloprotease [Spirochaetes bacterium]|nr:matrixin family metalloprotease [Spirochaetota bacterium]